MQPLKSSFIILLELSLLNSAASLPGAKPILHKCDDIFKKFDSTAWLLLCLDCAGSKDFNLKFWIHVLYVYLLYVCVYTCTYVWKYIHMWMYIHSHEWIIVRVSVWFSGPNPKTQRRIVNNQTLFSATGLVLHPPYRHDSGSLQHTDYSSSTPVTWGAALEKQNFFKDYFSLQWKSNNFLCWNG